MLIFIIMSLDAVKILEISITKNSKNEILEFIRNGFATEAEKSDKRGKNPQKIGKILTIVTPNPEQIVYARHDKHFREIINQADVAIPDGIGVVWAIKFLHLLPAVYHPQPTVTTIPGIEFMENLILEATKQRVPIALIGGRGGLALKTLECLQKTHQKLVGWAIDGPEMRIENFELRMKYENAENYFQELAKRIVETKTRMVFVGLGAPKQEYFIEKLSRELSLVHYQLPTLCMSVGGSFDEIAGRIPRAPVWVNRFGMKWLWRLVLEPWRIKRQLALIKFVWLVVLERYKMI